MPIPRIIHQTWKTDRVPNKWKESNESWQSLTKNGFQYILWTDEDNEKFIANHYPWFLKKFKSYKYNIQRADAIRYFILHHYGGIYSDLDLVNTKRFVAFYEMVKNDNLCIAFTIKNSQVGNQSYTNAFMMSSQQNPFWNIVWDLLSKPDRIHKWKKYAIRFTHYFDVLMSTGPGIINDAVPLHENNGGQVYKICPVLFRGLEGKGRSTEAIVKVLQGDSWHGKDAKFFKFLGKCYSNRESIYLGLFITFFILFLLILIAYIRIKRYRRFKQETGKKSKRK